METPPKNLKNKTTFLPCVSYMGIEAGDGYFLVNRGQGDEYHSGGRMLYRYRADSGLLELNPAVFPKGQLEQMLSLNNSVPSDGLTISISVPSPDPVSFKGVKSIALLSEEDGKSYPHSIQFVDGEFLF